MVVHCMCFSNKDCLSQNDERKHVLIAWREGATAGKNDIHCSYEGKSLPKCWHILQSSKNFFLFTEYCTTAADAKFDAIVEALTPETILVTMSLVSIEVKPVRAQSLNGVSDGVKLS